MGGSAGHNGRTHVSKDTMTAWEKRRSIARVGGEEATIDGAKHKHGGGMRTTKPADSLGLGRLARAFALDDPRSMGFFFTSGDLIRKK